MYVYSLCILVVYLSSLISSLILGSTLGLKSGTSTSLGEMPSVSGGFKLGSSVLLGSGGIGSSTGFSLENMSGGIKPGAGLSLTGGTQLASPAKDTWSCDTCLLVNKAEADSCIACSASKPGKSQAKSTVTGGLKLGGGGLNLSRKPQDSSGDSKWTCDTCLIQNKNSDSACVACTTPKPGSQKETKKDEHKSGGFQFGPTGGFKLGGGLTLGSVSTATSSNTSSHGTCLLPAATSTGNVPTTQQTLLLGTPSTTTSDTGFKLPSNVSLDNKPSTDSPLSGLTFGALNPSTGIKLGGGGLQTSNSLTLGGPILSTASASLTQSATNNCLGSSNASTGNSPLASIKLGSFTSTASVTSATTTSLLTGITLGGTFTSTAKSPLLSGIKVGGGFNTGTGSLTGGSPFKLGQSLTTSTSSNPLTGIKLGGMLTTTTTTAAASNSPLAGIKLGGGGGLVAPPTTVSGLLTQSQGLPKMNFALGNTSTNSVGLLSFTGSSPQAPAFQFSGTKTPASSMFGTSTPTSKSNTGLNFAPGFGGQQSQALSVATPAGNSGQAEMQSPDEMSEWKLLL